MLDRHSSTESTLTIFQQFLINLCTACGQRLGLSSL